MKRSDYNGAKRGRGGADMMCLCLSGFYLRDDKMLHKGFKVRKCFSSIRGEILRNGRHHGT